MDVMSQRGGQKRLRTGDESRYQPHAESEETSKMHSPVEQLESALVSIKQERQEWETERKSLQEKVAKLEKELSSEQDSHFKCFQAIEKLRDDVESAGWTIDDLRKQQEDFKKQLGAAQEAGQRRKEEGNRFHFVLAGNGQVGSIPRSHLESAPESLLCKMYNGVWEYARDGEGRALINCHPERWAAVLEHLATGAVPAERNPQLLEQARHWNLERLVDALEAMTPGVVVTTTPRTKEFTVRCKFVSVRKAIESDKLDVRLKFAEPHDTDRLWEVALDESGIFLYAPSQNEKLKVTCKVCVLLRDKVVKMHEGDHAVLTFSGGGDNCGYEFGLDLNSTLDQLLSEPVARADDCLVVELKLIVER